MALLLESEGFPLFTSVRGLAFDPALITTGVPAASGCPLSVMKDGAVSGTMIEVRAMPEVAAETMRGSVETAVIFSIAVGLNWPATGANGPP